MQLLQVAVLARLLQPGDFGLIALVLATIAFMQVFADVGVSSAIIHHKEISQEQLSSLYWLNVFAGGILSAALFLSSSLIADWFGEPRLERLLSAMSAVFLVTALAQQLRVMAEKAMEFTTLAVLELAASAAGLIVAVAWAYSSPDAMALVAGFVTSAVTLCVLCWVCLAKGWRPSFRFRLAEIRRFLRFGGYNMATNVANSILSQADIVIGGKMLSVESLGLYSLPRDLSLRLASVVNPIVTRVSFPAMAQVQNDPAQLKSIYLKSVWMTASVNFPMYLMLAVFAEEVVLLIFGERLMASAPLLRVLAIWGLVRSVGNPVGGLLYATGRVDLSLKWCAGLLVVVPLAVFASADFGAIGIAWAMLGVQVVSFVPGWALLIKPLCGASFSEYTGVMAAPLCAAVIAIGASAVLVAPVGWPLARLCVGIVLSAVFYVSASWILNRQWILSVVELIFPARPPIGHNR